MSFGRATASPSRRRIDTARLRSEPGVADPGTREDRSALFDYILAATQERTAFSPFKPRDFGVGEDVTEAEHVRSAMLALRDEFLAADTDAKLYYALTNCWITR